MAMEDVEDVTEKKRECGRKIQLEDGIGEAP